MNPLFRSAFAPSRTGGAESPHGKDSAPVPLTLRRVYILPTRAGLAFGFMLLLMLTGSINYSLSLGYGLTFLLGSMAVVSILHTFRNLAHLSIRPGKADPVFAGDLAGFNVCMENHSDVVRISIGVVARNTAPVFIDVPSRTTGCALLHHPAARRGWLQLPRFTVFTRYPLGLFRAWSSLELNARCIVYPRPDASNLPPPVPQSSTGIGIEFGQGSEDFSGLRPYHPGDSPRHIAWKTLAQERGMLTKQFSGQAESQLWLDWDVLAGMDTEARLSRLTRWVLDAHASSFNYGLRIPGRIISPACTEQHMHECLEALALYGL